MPPRAALTARASSDLSLGPGGDPRSLDRRLQCRCARLRSAGRRNDSVQGEPDRRRRFDAVRKCRENQTAVDRRSRAGPGFSGQRSESGTRENSSARHIGHSRNRCKASRHVQADSRLRLSSERENGERRDGAVRIRDIARVSSERQVRRTNSARGGRGTEGPAWTVGDELLRMHSARLSRGQVR